MLNGAAMKLRMNKAAANSSSRKRLQQAVTI